MKEMIINTEEAQIFELLPCEANKKRWLVTGGDMPTHANTLQGLGSYAETLIHTAS